MADEVIKVELKGRRLTISIDVYDLAFSFDHHPENMRETDSTQAWRVTDAVGFARDVVHEMEREGETGNTPITDMLDAVMMEAMNQGSEHLWLAGEDTNGK